MAMKTVACLHPGPSGKPPTRYRLTFEPYPYDPAILAHLLELLPRLLTPKFLVPERRRRPRRHRLSGLSRVAAQALYFLLDTDCLEVRTALDRDGAPHFWLVGAGQLMDPTAAQYEDFPYHAGAPHSWTAAGTPIDIRTLLLMRKVLRFDGKPTPNSKLPRLFW